MARSIRTVFFDVGETLIDETRHWQSWADWLGVPRLTFMAALGATIARGEPHRSVFDLFRPDIDLDHERALRAAAGVMDGFDRSDLYADALPCLHELRRQGYELGVAGNLSTHEYVAGLELPVDFVASSALWAVSKPKAEFFHRMAETAGQPPEHIAYVGDRLDFDITPALRVGMAAIHILRGPWAWIAARQNQLDQASATIRSLDELPAALVNLR